MARNFSSATDGVDCGDIAAMDGVVNLTISFWARRSASSRIVAVSKAAGANDRTGLSPWSDGNIYWIICNGSNSYLRQTYSYTNDVWYHYTGWFDGGGVGNANRAKVYIDGVFQSPTQFVGTIPATTDTNAASFIAGIHNSGGSNGDIGEVKVWGASLTANEIAQEYYGGNPRSEDLIVYLPLGWGSPEPDLSGNGHNGTLANSPTVTDSPPIGPQFGADTGLYEFASAGPVGPPLGSLSLLGTGR